MRWVYDTHKNTDGFLSITNVCDFIRMYFHQWRSLISWRPVRIYAITTPN